MSAWGTGFRRGWIVRVALPASLLLIVASVVPDDENTLARAVAQVAAVAVPLGIELVRDRWQRGRNQAQAIAILRGRLDPLFRPPPAESRAGLDDAFYRIAPYWGRSALHKQLNAARAHSGPVVVLLTGLAWTGKTRLLTEWALTLPTGVVAGWLKSGNPAATEGVRHSVETVVAEGKDLGVPLVSLHAGAVAGAWEALAALAGAEDSSVMLVLEVRDASRLVGGARGMSPGVGRLVENAIVVTVDSPGAPTDMEHRYGEMVLAYGRVAGTPAPRHTPRSSPLWAGAPIGLWSFLAMLHSLGGRGAAAGLSPMESLGRYWVSLSVPWLKDDRPAPRFGLPSLSDRQLETALVAQLLTAGEQTGALLARLPLFTDQLPAHQVAELTKWAEETTRAGHTRAAVLAAVAATQGWTDEERETLGSAAAATPRGLAQMIRHLVSAEQILGERPRLTETMVEAVRDSLETALQALVGEAVTRPIDMLVAERVALATLSCADAESLLDAPSVDRMPHTRTALLQQQYDNLPADTPEERRARLGYNLALMLSEVGRLADALTTAEDAVALYRRLADPDTGNPDRYTPDLAQAERWVQDLRVRLRE